MRSRLTVAMVLVVAGALLLAGLGSLLLVRQSTLNGDVSALSTEASKVASLLAADTNAGKRGVTIASEAGTIRQATSPFTTSSSFLLVEPGGSVTTYPPSAAGGSSAAVSALVALASEPQISSDLLAGDLVSGSRGTTAFALVPLPVKPAALANNGIPSGSKVALGMTTDVKLPAGIGIYFLFAGGLCLVVAGVVATLLAGRFSRPLTLAVRTTRRIAAGDLDARMPIERASPELAQLGESINAMAADLARARATERQFVLSISHDLRTPLTSIRGYAEAIADGAAPDPVHAASVIASEAGRLERLFQDLLDLARLDAKRFAIDVRRVDLPEVAVGAAEGLRRRFEEAQIALTVDPPAGELVVAADPDRLAQIVTNLLENARKYARSNARVAVVPVPTDPQLVALLVEDDGPGIPEADLPHVFERFFTGSGRERVRSGTGLGLAIVAELVQAMGGDVIALSPTSRSGGTRIVVRLRRWSGPAGEPALPARPPAPSIGAAPAAPDAAGQR
jgi:two-component system, OmpR family, sensor kinase